MKAKAYKRRFFKVKREGVYWVVYFVAECHGEKFLFVAKSREPARRFIRACLEQQTQDPQ